MSKLIPDVLNFLQTPVTHTTKLASVGLTLHTLMGIQNTGIKLSTKVDW